MFALVCSNDLAILFQERLLNLVIGVLTTIFVLFTLVSAFVFPRSDGQDELHPYNIAFAGCIALVCGSLLVLVSLISSAIISAANSTYLTERRPAIF